VCVCVFEREREKERACMCVEVQLGEKFKIQTLKPQIELTNRIKA
jgi:hypothetical protein